MDVCGHRRQPRMRARSTLTTSLYVLAHSRSEWEAHATSPELGAATPVKDQVYKRRLGPTEVSYYLGSRGEGVESGVNDM